MALLKAFGIFFAQYLVATTILNSSMWLTQEFVLKPQIAVRTKAGLMAGIPVLGGWMFGAPLTKTPTPSGTVPAAPGATVPQQQVVGY